MVSLSDVFEQGKSAWVQQKISALPLENVLPQVWQGLIALLAATPDNFLTTLKEHQGGLLGDEGGALPENETDFFEAEDSYEQLMVCITKQYLVMRLHQLDEQSLKAFLQAQNKRQFLLNAIQAVRIAVPSERITDNLVSEIAELAQARLNCMAAPLPDPRRTLVAPSQPLPLLEISGEEPSPNPKEKHEKAPQEPLQSRPRPSMLLWMEQKGVLGFVDEKVVVDSSEQPKAAAQVVNNSLEQSLPQETHYLGVKITEGEVIRSKGELPSGLRGVLEQDHTGKVTDKTVYAMDRSDPNAEERMSNDKSVIALKAAKMLLDNYKSDSGPVVIRGRDPQMAAKMYAALLFLTKDSPLFKSLKIDSTVVGFEPPGRFTSDRSFIKKQLGVLAGSPTAASIKKQVAELRQEANDVGEYGVPSPSTRREIIEESTYSPHTKNKP